MTYVTRLSGLGLGTIHTHSHLSLWLLCHPLLQEIGNLRNLRFFEASENHLMALPVTIDGLNLLTDLYLQENLLSMLPDTIGEGEGGGGREEGRGGGGSGRGGGGRVGV